MAIVEGSGIGAWIARRLLLDMVTRHQMAEHAPAQGAATLVRTRRVLMGGADFCAKQVGWRKATKQVRVTT